MNNHFRISALTAAFAALTPTWAFYRMADGAPAVAAAPAEQATEVVNDTATLAAAAADADTAEKVQAESDETPATVSIDVPAQHQSLLERAAALLAQADAWIVDNIEAGISHFENLFKSEAKAADDSAKDA